VGTHAILKFILWLPRYGTSTGYGSVPMGGLDMKNSWGYSEVIASFGGLSGRDLRTPYNEHCITLMYAGKSLIFKRPASFTRTKGRG
jgi:hypothetical protein